MNERSIQDGGERAQPRARVKVARAGVLALGFVTLIGYGIYLMLGEKAEYPLDRTVRYRLEVRNDTGQVQKNVVFWSLGPVAQTAFQRTRTIEASHPFEQTSDSLGNQVLRFRFDTLPPYASRRVTVTARLGLAEQPQTVESVEPEDYLGPDNYMPTGDGGLVELAGSLRGADAQKTARHTLDWVNQNLRYAGYTEDRRGALHAFRSRRGDCTEYMDLFGALMRIARVPTRAVGGFITAEDSLLRGSAYHNWTEIHLEDGWRVADPQNGLFPEQPQHYIALQILGNPVGVKGPERLFGSESRGVSIRML